MCGGCLGQRCGMGDDCIAGLGTNAGHLLERAVLGSQHDVGEAVRLKVLPDLHGALRPDARHARQLDEAVGHLLARALEQVPDSLVELTRVPGIGAKGAMKIWQHLEPDSFADIVLAAENGTLKEVPGVGAKASDAVIAHAAALAEAPAAHAGVAVIRRDTAAALVTSVTGLLHEHVTELQHVHVGGAY